ncbi:MAG: response regulator transcription factor [Chloroflexi bacterium]|nr:response regulator transcription factor [Chloroflexota bacterium]
MLGVRVLIVDDDPSVLGALRRSLSTEGYEVDTADTGVAALALARERTPDVVILDVMLPGMTGYEVCQRLRAFLISPILMLTARDTVPDKVARLESGADDYLVKPFALDELIARLRALLRRRMEVSDRGGVLVFAELRLDPGLRQVWRDGEPIELTAREFDLLEFFMRHPRMVHTRNRILERVWKQSYLGGSNIVDVQVRSLRAKLESGGRPRLLQTYRGVGYALRED